jgi:hypothetical protein
VEITEHRLVPEPVVYGYLHLDTPGSARAAALTGTLVAYCEQHELDLADVFTDHRDPGRAFTGLITALRTPGAYGVVVPTARHLGHRPIAAARYKAIVRTQARLLIVRPRPAASGPDPARPW